MRNWLRSWFSISLHSVGVSLAAALLCAPAMAQYSADKPVGVSAQSAPAYLRNAGIDQRLGGQIPLNLRFTDSNGVNAPLGAVFTHRPVAMALVYYKCAM